MTLNSTNDSQTHFQIKTPTKIIGEPTFDQLKTLHSHLKINAQCIHSSRGGSAHGHLGLVLSAVDYQQLTLTPFIRPVDPGDFLLPTNINITMDQIAVLRENHKSLRAQFEKVDNVEAALKQFLVEAIEPDYLLEIRNPTTENLEGTIPQIMRSLFQSYGDLTAKELLKKQQTLTNYVYDPHQPIDKLFQVAQEYQDYATFHGTPQPPTTIITTVYEVLRKTTKFQRALEDWSAKPANEKSWENFKRGMRKASKNLREHTPDTSGQAGFSNQVVEDITQGVANMLQPSDETNNEAQQFLQNLTDAVHQNQSAFQQINNNFNTLQQEVQSMNAARNSTQQQHNRNRNNRYTNNHQAPYSTDFNQGYTQMPLANAQGNPQMPTPNYVMQPPPPFNPAPVFNRSPNQQTPPSLFHQLNPPYAPRPYRNNNNPNNGNNNSPAWINNQPQQQWNPSNHRGRGRGNHNGGRGNNTRGGNRRANHYCWTHGAKGHPSDQCNAPANGHQWTATFSNRMGGNTEGCWN